MVIFVKIEELYLSLELFAKWPIRKMLTLFTSARSLFQKSKSGNLLEIIKGC